MTRIQKEILRNLLLAQIGSDAGKGIYPYTNVPGWERARQLKYMDKANRVEKAIRLINSCPPCGISYFAGVDECNKGVLYFNLSKKATGLESWLQVSFHMPKLRKDSFLYGLFKRSAGKKTSWAGERGRDKENESRRSCTLIAATCGWSYKLT